MLLKIKEKICNLLYILFFISIVNIISYCLTGCGIDIFNKRFVIADYVYNSEIAVKNAQEIIDKYADLDDREKLFAYYKTISEYNVYNREVANDSCAENDIYFSASSFSYIFDGDSNTNSMCLGYANAFRYLCNHSTFNNDVECTTKYVYVHTKNEIIGHAINVVRINDKYYYLDSCWGDNTDYGFLEAFFLIEMPENAKKFYIYPNISYYYSKEKDEYSCSQNSEAVISLTQLDIPREFSKEYEISLYERTLLAEKTQDTFYLYDTFFFK